MTPAAVAELTKGANVTLSALADELGSVSVMLEWAVENGRQLDADVSAVLIGDDGMVRSNDDLVFYNQKAGADGAVRLRGKMHSTAERFTAFADIIDVDVDDLADSIEKVVLAASMDPATGGTFGQLAYLRLRLLSSDSVELLRFDIADATSERAFVFGEIYRRDGKWKFKAVGQGYDGGIDALVADYGLATEGTARQAEYGPIGIGADGDDLSSEAATEQLDVRKDAAHADPEAGALARAASARDWQPARLFPVAGIGGAQEQERRATSALLAVLVGVRELGDLFRGRMGAPQVGPLATFVEVPFTLNGSAYRPDGVIQVQRPGRSPWTGLVEVKTGRDSLSERQLAAYLQIARDEGFDGLLTISSQITPIGQNHPLATVLATPGVGVAHLSWPEIRYHCQLLARHGIADASQAYVLRELLRYLEHPRSGAQMFEDMGPHWVRVRNGVIGGTLRSTSAELAHVIERFDQLTSYLCLHLGGLAGRAVRPVLRADVDATHRRAFLADELCRLGSLTAALCLDGIADLLTVRTNVRTSTVTCTITVAPPQAGAEQSVDWLLRRLHAAPAKLRVEAVSVGPGGVEFPTRAEQLAAVRRRPGLLAPEPAREIRRFVVSNTSPLGAKRGRGKDTYITSAITAIEKFRPVLDAVATTVALRPATTAGH